MAYVTKRQLNQQTAAVLAMVGDGEPLVVTEHGEPRWQLSRYRPSGGALERLEREGRIGTALPGPIPWDEIPRGRRYREVEIDALLDEMRGDH